MNARTAIGGLLVLSVLLNVLLLLSSGPSANSSKGGSDHAGGKSSEHKPVAIAGPRDECFSLRRSLEEIETKYQLGRPLSERFETESRVSDDEERMRRLIAAVFSDTEQYDLECRERICRITVDDDRAPKDWQARLQKEPQLKGHFSQMLFSSDGVTVELQDEAAAGAVQLWLHVATAMGESAALKSCKHANPTPSGEVTFTLALVSPRRLEATVGGSLATQSAGLCMRRVMEDLVRQIEIPPTVTSVAEYPFTIKVP
jgi:hypothetical protein